MIIERDDEAFLAILAHHHGFKGVNVRAAGLVFLFHLDGIPAFFQAEFAFLLLARRGAGGDGEDAAKIASNCQVLDATLATASRRSSSENGLLITMSTPGSGSPKDCAMAPLAEIIRTG